LFIVANYNIYGNTLLNEDSPTSKKLSSIASEIALTYYSSFSNICFWTIGDSWI